VRWGVWPRRWLGVLAGLAIAMLAVTAWAAAAVKASDSPSPVVIRAGKSDGPYNWLASQLAATLNRPHSGAPEVTVEESQGSVQNVIDAVQNHSPAMFTAPPNVIAEAQRGDKPYGSNPDYRNIRALFPIPFQTMHFVVRQDSGVKNFADLAGKPFIKGGSGSLGERQTTALVKILGLDNQMQLLDIDSNAAPSTLKNNQAAGFAVAGCYPIDSVKDLAGEIPIRLLGLPPDLLKKALAADGTTIAVTIPKGTYPGMTEDVRSVALPAGVYTTRAMSSATAYRITKAFWSGRGMLAQGAPVWQAVTPAMLAILGTRLHPGALRYYLEAGIKVPKSLQ
jgi:TRAP transporter TAXI family solute receptor